MTTMTVAGKSLRLILPAHDRERLSGTCFRGRHVAEAGNFFRWSSFRDMVADELFTDLFGDVLTDMVEENVGSLAKGFGEPLTLPCAEPVGWTSALPRELVNGARLVLKRLNDRATMMAVALDDREHPAPRTNLVSMTLTICEDFKRESDLVAIVHTIYPGPHLGVLRGDITAVKGFVLFDFHHPGGDSFVELEP